MIYTADAIVKLRKSLGMTQEDFAKELDISRQWLIKLEKGAEPVGPHQVALIDKLLHEKSKESLQSTLQEPSPGYGNRVPFYDIEAMGGSQYNADMIPVSESQSTIDVGDLLSDSECAIRIYGNSMTPSYPSGCVVGLRVVKDGIVEYGNVYVIETEDNRYLKRILKDHDDKGYICYSDNLMKFTEGPREGYYYYEPFLIPYEKIKRLYRVTGVIKRNVNSPIFGNN